MSVQSSNLVDLSKLLLLACDQSYAGRQLIVDENVLSSFDDPPFLGQFHPPFETSFPGYVVSFVYEDPSTGFKGVVYRNEVTSEIIVAMAGTDGADFKDWWSDVTHYGWNQWKENREAVLQDLNVLIAQLRDKNNELPRIYFTGQSLGGALAQYAAYEFVETHDQYDPAKLSLVTFNGLGAVASLQDELPNRVAPENFPNLVGTQFDPLKLSGFSTIAHYASSNDLVSRLGGGHLGAKVYSFPGVDFATFNPETDSPYLLDTISAHRIESGFYYPLTEFNLQGSDAFTDSVAAGSLSPGQLAASDLRIDGLQKLASNFGNLFRRDSTSSEGAMLQLLFGGLAAVAVADAGQVNALVDAYIDTRYRAGKYEEKDDEYRAAKNTNWAFRLRIGAAAVGVSSFAGPYGLVLKLAGAIALAPLYNIVEGFKNDDADLLLRNTYNVQRQGAGVPDGSYRESLERSTLLGAALDLTDTSAAGHSLATTAQLARDDIDDFALAMVSGDDWYYKTANFLVGRANALGRPGLAQTALNEFWTYARNSAGSDVALVASVAEQNRRFATDWSKAVAGLSNDLAIPKETPLQVNGIASYAEKRTFWNGVLSGLENVLDLFVGTANAADNRAAITEAMDEVLRGAQSIVVLPGHSENPFDDPSFDPDSYPISSVNLREGGLSTFTAYLPYGAPTGGQAISFHLGGVDVDKLSILNDEINVDASGNFMLTVGEGERELAVEVAALEDIDEKSTLTLSAQLVDSAGTPTHQEHQELTLSLDGMAESTAAPGGGLEYHGDWDVKPFPSFYDDGTPAYSWEDGSRMYEVGWDPRYPSDRPNLERTLEPWPADVPPGFPSIGSSELIVINGTEGSDQIWLGDQFSASKANSYGGDDVIFGTQLSQGRMNAGPGDDWVEGGAHVNLAADEYGFVDSDNVRRLADDLIYGGAGDDYLWGETRDTEADLSGPESLSDGVAGDWINGGSGTDRIFGSVDDDVLQGGPGEDFIVGGPGRDVILGDDDLRVDPNIGVLAWSVLHPLHGNPGHGIGDTAYGGFEVGLFPAIALSDTPDWVDTLFGDPSIVYYKTGGAKDTLIGGAGDDIVIGQVGDDTIYGGDGADILAGWEGADTIIGGADDDLIAGDFGRYETLGQRGIDRAFEMHAGARNRPDAFDVPVDQIGNDFLDGGEGNDVIFGEAGDDTLLGREGADTLYGDATYLPAELNGNDFVDGGAGDDFIYGGGGDDDLRGGEGADHIAGDAGNDNITGGVGGDDLSGGEGDDTILGGAGSDLLAGDAGADILYGGEDADEISGGEGDDAIYGGSGADIISGDDGNDLLNGGAGRDVMRGGGGDDIYAFDFGDGRDSIEDSEGANQIRFAEGVLPQDLNAKLDNDLLSAAVTYGSAGDVVTFDAGNGAIQKMEFADGTSWGRKKIVALLPAAVTQAGGAATLIVGSENLRNDLRGGSGDDTVLGSGNDDTLAGGDGADLLDGAGGADAYSYQIGETGVDALSDRDVSARAYLDWYYGRLGISDWELRGQLGGQYLIDFGGDDRVVFSSLEEAQAAFPDAPIVFIEPLPELAPVVSRTDTAALDQLIQAGVMSRDVVRFGDGLSVDDLSIKLTVNGSIAEQHPEAPWFGGGQLSVHWGNAGFDLELSDDKYGFAGTNLLTDGDPDDSTPGGWRGYRLGEGIEAFEFTDGTTLTLGGLLQYATVAYVPYEFHANSGLQTISALHEAISFDVGISSWQVMISRDGLDMTVSLLDGSQGRIAGWYADSDNVPQVSLQFTDGSEISAQQLTEAGLVTFGSLENDVIEGVDGFSDQLFGDEGDDILLGRSGDDVLYGNSGDDVLDGGPGSDILSGGPGADAYVLSPGSGVDTVDDPFDSSPLTEDRVRLAEGLSPADVMITRTSHDLSIWVRGTQDRIELPNWFDDADKRLGRIEFADGTFLTADEMEGRLEVAPGTEDDDVILGSSGVDTIFALGGVDEIYADAGNDFVNAGADEDYVEGGEGIDILLGGSGDDELDDWDDSNLLEGGTGDDFLVSQGATLFVGGEGDDYVETYGEGAIVAFNAGDGNDTVGAYGGFTLSLGGGLQRADLRLSADGDDLLLSTGSAESIRLTREFADDPQSWPSIQLQMFGSVHLYDFNAAIEEFHAAGSGAEFALDGVLQAHETFTSETLAIGGAIAWKYATTGSLADLSLVDIRSVIGRPSFGVALQPITVGTPNEAPVLAEPIPNQVVTEYLPFELDASAVFSDPDMGDVLAYTAAEQGAAFLPDWLTFDAIARRFVGSPVADDLGTYAITLTVTDPGGLSASNTFAITVAPTPDQVLVGTARNETLTTHSGNDRIDGGAGTDVMTGGRGDDVYVVDRTADVVIERPGEGTDVVESAATYTLPDNVENLLITGTRSVHGTGNALGNTITGNSAANVLDGAAGADILIGGLGNDTYIVDDEGDQVVENPAEGTDTVKSSVGFSLPDEVENLTLTGTVAVTGTGNIRNNVLTGNAAQSVLAGGDGNDTYVVDDARIVVVEGSGEGTDLVKASVSFGLAPNVEKLTLTGTDAIDGSGNELNNALTGNEAANALFGGDGNDLLNGGGGADTLVGGAGDDTYGVDGRDDAVVESLGEGTDVVKSSASYALGGNVENLTLTGDDAIDGTGNAADNVLTGNSAANVLIGGDGQDTLKGNGGADSLIGGRGDDVYVVDDEAAAVLEYAGEGTDLVKSSIDFTLGDNVENLTLTGSADRNGFGNALDNIIRGNSGANLLQGYAGSDTLVGNLANDVLQGGDGADKLSDNGGNNLLDGGTGSDTLTGGSGNELLIGGRGNDTVTTGTGADIIAFNRGDGQDTVNPSVGADNTLSLGGGIRYADLSIKKSGTNLILQLGVDALSGVSEQITFKNWYATNADNRSVVRLQVMAEAMADFDPTGTDSLLARKVQTFDFLGLAAAFDAGRSANPAITSWALAPALAQRALGGSDTEAMGGDAAYGYGSKSTLDGMSLQTARDTIGAAAFGSGPQHLTPVLEGGAAADALHAGPVGAALAGGGGADTLDGDTGNDFLAGGTGDDTIDTGAGANVIAFNSGDGADAVRSDAGAMNALSLGGGISYDRLSLSKSGNDLVLDAGGGDQITMKDWYAGNDTLLNLQIVLDATSAFDAASADALYNRKIQDFDFRGLVGQFDRARAETPGLTSWALTNALLQFHLSASDDSALGGDLAYAYGRNGSLSGISVQAAQQAIGAPGFGADAQALRPFSGLQDGFAKLS